MRKILVVVLTLLFIFMTSGCASNSNPYLKGSYQNEKDVNGSFILLSFMKGDNSFVEYIDNREVDRGTYEKIEVNKYILTSELQNFKITLNKDNSFGIIIKKLNGGNPITLVNIDDVPTYFSTAYNDVEEYKKILGE